MCFACPCRAGFAGRVSSQGAATECACAVGGGFGQRRAAGLLSLVGPMPGFLDVCVRFGGRRLGVGWSGLDAGGGLCSPSSRRCCSRMVRIAIFPARIEDGALRGVELWWLLQLMRTSCCSLQTIMTGRKCRCATRVACSSRSDRVDGALFLWGGRGSQRRAMGRRGVCFRLRAAARVFVLRRRHCCSRKLEWTQPTRMGASQHR